MGQKGIGVSNLPNVKYRSFCKAGIDFNIMTVGSNGLGKSSFVNQMLSMPILSFDPFIDANDGQHGNETIKTSDHDGTGEAEERYMHKNSMLNVQISKFFVMENEFQTRITVTEVDGVGDNICNEGCWSPIVDLIHSNFGDFLAQERKNVRSLIKDKRIHVCLYFLEPNPGHVKMADIMAMKEISKVCNLIPIVGKSDLLNDSEREECRDKIAEVLSSENIEIFCLGSSGEERGNRPKSPFFVVAKSFGSDDINDHKREYPWGVMRLDKSETNDFYFLVDSLVAKNLTNLVEATEVFYDDYRTKEIGQSLMARSDGLGHDDKKLTKEIQKKIREDERTIMELRKRLVEKKKSYESKLLEMTGRCGNKAINSS